MMRKAIGSRWVSRSLTICRASASVGGRFSNLGERRRITCQLCQAFEDFARVR